MNMKIGKYLMVGGNPLKHPIPMWYVKSFLVITFSFLNLVSSNVMYSIFFVGGRDLACQ